MDTGIKVQIITPRREAELSLKGSQLDVEAPAQKSFLRSEAGAPKIAVINKGKIAQHASLPIGTGRVIAQSGLANPCPQAAKDLAEKYVNEILDSVELSRNPASIAVASGGVARGLMRAIHPDGEKSIFREELDYVAWSTAKLSTDRIGSGIRSETASSSKLLLPGAIVYRALMERVPGGRNYSQ